MTLNLSGATGTGSSGDAAGDTLSGIEHVLGSGGDDQFLLGFGHGWSIDGGAGHDSVTLADNSGSVDAASLAAILTHTEEIDFTGSNVDANLTVDANFIQSIVGNGNDSTLTLRFDGGDSLAVDASAHYDQSGNDYTFYSDAAMTTVVARLSVA